MLWRIGAASRRLPRDVPAFRARVDAVLAPLGREDLATWPADRVIALYHRLEDELLDHWRPPLVNDFFAMIHFGVLGRLVERWLPGEPPTLVNDLLCGEGGVISTEPARLLMAMAREVAATTARCGGGSRASRRARRSTAGWSAISSASGTAAWRSSSSRR
jgi:pyruvate,water dikinase